MQYRVSEDILAGREEDPAKAVLAYTGADRIERGPYDGGAGEMCWDLLFSDRAKARAFLIVHHAFDPERLTAEDESWLKQQIVEV